MNAVVDLFEAYTETRASKATPPTSLQVIPLDPANASIEAKSARAQARLEQLLSNGHPLCVAWSAGKDSSVALNLALAAAARLRGEGTQIPPIVVTHADTGVENPEMVAYAEGEMQRVRVYAERHNLSVRIETSRPNLSELWAVRVIGGRALPPFPGTNRDCTLGWKILPMQKLRRRVMRELGFGQKGQPEPVTLIGTRYDESAERGKNMRERGDSDVELRRGTGNGSRKNEYLYLSPIAFWSTEDVWEYLGLARAGAIDAYSDFSETMRIYADAMGTSCAVVADDISKTLKRPACGARTGCAICTMVGRDHSLENMIEHDERYAYMRGLNRLQRFIVATRWDMGRRSWIGRTINDGYVTIAPDAYSPAMMEELLRYSLSLDAEESTRARELGLAKPRFQLVPIEALFAIDTMWSLNGFHKPFHALALYKEVYIDGERYPVPELEPVKEAKLPAPRYLYVGDQWGEGVDLEFTALRNPVLEMAGESYCMGSRQTVNDMTIMDIETSTQLSVDAEAAYLLLDFELDELLHKHDDPSEPPQVAAQYYLMLGMVQIRSGNEEKIDLMMRRAGFKHRMRLAGEVDPTMVLPRTVSAAEMRAHLLAGTEPLDPVRAKGPRRTRHVVE